MAKRGKRPSNKVKMNREIAEGLALLAQQYRDLFGCPQTEGVLLFDVAALEDRRSMHREMVRRALDAKINPVLVFATYKTRRIVSADNEHLLSREAREQWNAAIEEATDVQESGIDLVRLIHDEVYPERSCIGYNVAKDQIIALWFCAEWLSKSSKAEAPLARALVAQAVQLARVFRFASDNHFYPELIALCRPAFEIALRIEHLNQDPELAIALHALAGIREGTWRYVTRGDGRKDVRNAIEIATGREAAVAISNSRLAEKSSFAGLLHVFEQIYPLLAMHTHPNATFDLDSIDEPDSSHEIGFLYLNSVLCFLLGSVVVSGFLEAVHESQIKHAAIVTLIMSMTECEALQCTHRIDVEVCRELLELVRTRLMPMTQTA